MDKVDNSSNSIIFSCSGPIIGLFAKEPVAGQVKTRLTPPLSAEQACQLYRQALQETLTLLRATGVAVVLCYAGRRDWFSENFPELPLLAQTGDGLGLRMRNAVESLFAGGAGPVLLSGSDNPDLPPALVRDIIASLETTDVATVPCSDGGYAIVGMRRPEMALFDEIPWSTSGVLAATRERCLQLGLTYHETAGWHDLDEIEDVRKLVARSPGSQTARYVLAELGELL